MSNKEIWAHNSQSDPSGGPITGTTVDGKRGLDVISRGIQPDGDFVTLKADGTAIETTEILAGTSLNGAISDSDVTITVDSTADFPDSGIIGINEEIITYTGKTATTFTGCVRGAYQTTARSHVDNEPVGETYVSGWVDTDGWDSIEVFVSSAQESKTLGLLIQFSDDVQAVSPTVRAETRYSYDRDDIARGYEDIRFQSILDGFRIIYTNGAVTQADFFLHANLRVNGNVSRYNKGGALVVGNFDVEVALGLVSNYEVGTKFGSVTGIDAADNPVDIWYFANDALAIRSDTKTFPSTASVPYFASSSASDTSVVIIVEFIDAAGFARTEDVSLNGQTSVALSIAALDINRMYVSGSVAPVGNIYGITANNFSVGGTPNDVTQVLAFIPVNYGQSQQSQFTVPLRQKLVITAYKVSVSRSGGLSGSAVVTLRTKELGGIQRVRREFFPTTSSPIDKENASLVVPGGAQVVWRLDDVSDGDTNVSCVWDYVLIDD